MDVAFELNLLKYDGFDLRMADPNRRCLLLLVIVVAFSATSC